MQPTLIALALSSLFTQVTVQAAEPAVLAPVIISDSKIQDLPKEQNFQASEIAAARASTSDTASLLNNIPGVQVYSAGGVSSLPVIHGLADDRLRIKVDGMDLIASCPNHMNPALSYVDPSNLGLLKVYAGITPVSQGGDSIGGTIVAETKAPEFAAAGQGNLSKGEVGAFYRSNNKAMGGNVAATLATETFNISYSGALSQADNYKAGKDFKSYTATGNAGQTLGRDEVGSSAYKTGNHTLGFAMRNANHLFEAKVGYQDMPKQLYPNQRMDLLDNKQLSFNLRHIGQFDWGSLQTRVYHEKVEHFMDFGADKRFWYGTASGGVIGSPCAPLSGTAPTCAAGMPMYTEGKTTGASVKADVLLPNDGLLRVGGELQAYRLDDWWTPSGGGMWPGTFQNINNGERDRKALFGEWEARLAPQWMTLIGLRFEQVRTDAGSVHGYSSAPGAMGNQVIDSAAFNAKNRQRTDNNWDFTSLANYKVDAGQDIEFGFARKVRSPNLYERYTWSTWTMASAMNNFVGDGNGYIGDVDLKPEKAHTVSASFDWHAADRNWEFKATPFYTRVTDYIDAVRCPVNGTTCTAPNFTTTNQFVNLQYANQSARLYGLDLSGKMPLGKTEFGQFGLKGLLSYTNGKNRDTGDDLYNIMPLNSKLTLTQKQGGWDNALEWLLVKAKDHVSDVRNEVKTGGYNLFNLRTSYSWKQVRVDFGVENLFDKFYYLPLGGAYTGQGRTMSLNPTADSMFAWGTAVPGMGRSAYVGVNVKF